MTSNAKARKLAKMIERKSILEAQIKAIKEELFGIIEDSGSIRFTISGVAKEATITSRTMPRVREIKAAVDAGFGEYVTESYVAIVAISRERLERESGGE